MVIIQLYSCKTETEFCSTPVRKMSATKADLSQYLNKKGVNTILVKIVEEILINKPEDVVAFMTRHLFEMYPEETEEIKSSLISAAAAPTFKPNGPELSSSSSSLAPIEIEQSDEYSLSSDSDDSGDDDNDNDDAMDTGEEETPPIPAPAPARRSTRRRTSICAEKLNPSKMESSLIKKVPKTDDESERIMQILQDNVLFRHLHEEQLKTVQGAMFLVEKEQADVIIKQGDDGDNFYIIDKGEVDVYIKSGATNNCDDDNDDGDANNAPQEELVVSYHDGASFGELAIMYNAPRAASCIAKSDVRLWALDRVSFKLILMETAIKRREEHKSFLQQVPVLSQMTEYEFLCVADALQEETFEDGAVVCKEGDPGERFYIIKDGCAVCTQRKNDTDGEIEVARLKSGAYFGEVALLTDKKRQASVKANGVLKCLSLDRRTFSRVMGPLQEILLRNAEQYTSFVAANI